MFFWLDPKEHKGQERNDVQHVSFIRLDLSGSTTVTSALSHDAISNSFNITKNSLEYKLYYLLVEHI
jgi:hypothetical protein